MDPIVDWQVSRHEIKARGQYLLETGKWADCHFLVGQQMLPGHKLMLAMASPVFEAMFYGGLPEKNDPITILDVQPDAFKALLEYIYTDKININSLDKACELCYAAKKYMLPFVVEQCTKFLWSDLCPKNACKAYEFAKLFEEPRLMERCLQIICTKTLEVIQEASFEDIEMNTFLTILDQDYLHIDNELDLFFALTRYAVKHEQSRECSAENDEQSINEQGDQAEQAQAQAQAQEIQQSQDRHYATIRDAIKKIRFLTLNPQQFAEGPARSNLLSQADAFAILMNISSPNGVHPMPTGFSTSLIPRGNTFPVSESPIVLPVEPLRLTLDALETSPHQQPLALSNAVPMDEVRDLIENRKYYCVRTIRQQTDCLNTSVLDCSVTFSVDHSICITGVQVPTQVLGEAMMQNHAGNLPDRYSELLYAHLLDSHGSRLTYTHCTSRVRFDSLLEISFDRPVFIQRHKMYKIGVVFNKVGWYPMCTCVPAITCDNVCFTFGIGSPNESVRDGLIRAIVFTYTRDNM